LDCKKKCSIYKSEIITIITVLKHIENHPNQNYSIFTDSLGTITSIQNNFHTNGIAIKIIIEVQHLKAQDKNAQFILIPGHCKIYDNDLANQRAKNTVVSMFPN